MKSRKIYLIVFGLFFIAPINYGNAQVLKKLGKKSKEAAERGVENAVERKVEQKTEEATEEAIETVFGIPKKIIKKNDTIQQANIDGTWYYESLTGVPGFENLNECGQKSNIIYTDNEYTTIFYDNDCNILAETSGTYSIEGNVMEVMAHDQNGNVSTKVTSTQTIMEQSENRMVIQDELTGAVVTLVRREE